MMRTSNPIGVCIGSIAMTPILTRKPGTSVLCMSTPSVATKKGVWSSASTKSPGCRFSSGSIPPNWPSPASRRNVSRNTSAMACGRYWPPLWSQLAKMARYDWVLDNLNTHWSLDVCRLVASWCALPWTPKALERGSQRRAFLCDPTHKHVFHFTPTHGSWLNQVELWFSVLARRFLKRGDFCSGEDFETQLCAYLEGYNTHEAHPYRWTYTGQPLVRATPFSQTCRQQRQGRAWFSPRPQRFERALYPPRPYKRAATQLVMNL